MLNKLGALIMLVFVFSVGVIGHFYFHMTSEQTLFTVLFFFLYAFVYSLQRLKDEKESKKVQKELETQLKQMTLKAKSLEGESKATGMFLASMSHEIRTPLNGIVGLTELLDGTKLNEEQKEFVSMVRASSEHLNEIVNDVLDLSKMNAEKMELESIPFNVFKKIETSVGMFVTKMDAKGIELGLYIDPKIPQILIGDPTRLSQVVTNLVSNAVKFTNKDGKITIVAEYVKKTGDDVTFKVSVKDSGIGMTKAQQNKIFEAYGQADASTTRKSGGTGLGLTISSRLVKAMGGELKVESEMGEGTTFFFTVTLKREKVSEEKKYPKFEKMKVGMLFNESMTHSELEKTLKKYVHFLGATFKRYDAEGVLQIKAIHELPDVLIIDHHYFTDNQKLEKYVALDCKSVLVTSGNLKSSLDRAQLTFDETLYAPATLEKVIRILSTTKDEGEPASNKVQVTPVFEDINVLVAEDNTINQKLIRIVLENFGVNVTIASDGQEAFELRKIGNYDMIFMDIQMPVLSGIEATKKILEFEKESGQHHVPIIALTANALPGDREKYMSEGMDNYTTKPLQTDKIKTLIEEYAPVKQV